MTTQAQTFQATHTQADIEATHAFCDDLDTYLKTGILPVLVGTWKGPQTFHVTKPLLVTLPHSGERKIACKIVLAPQGFEFMIGQQHSLSLLL